MKLMKKLSLLIALCICLTVTGVYATWVYTKDNDVADQHQHLSLALTGVEYSGNYGIYTLDYQDVKISIDQKAPGDHTAVLDISGDIVVTYEPGSNAPVEYKTGGIPTTFQFNTSIAQDAWTYADTQIFNVDTTVHDVEWEPVDDGTFTFTISAEELASYITLGDFVLDTKTDYDAFNTALGKGMIGIIISDGTTVTPAP